MDQRRGHHIYPHERREVPGVGLAQADHCRLRGAVERVATAHFTGHRSDVDDAALGFVRHFPFGEVFGEIDQRLEVDGEDLVYLLIGVGIDTFTVINTGVIHQTINTCMALIESWNEPLDNGHIRKVGNVRLEHISAIETLQYFQALGVLVRADNKITL